MITTETPYKLAEIIRDTWPNLYRPTKETYNINLEKFSEILNRFEIIE